MSKIQADLVHFAVAESLLERIGAVALRFCRSTRGGPPGWVQNSANRQANIGLVRPPTTAIRQPTAYQSPDNHLATPLIMISVDSSLTLACHRGRVYLQVIYRLIDQEECETTRPPISPFTSRRNLRRSFSVMWRAPSVRCSLFSAPPFLNTFRRRLLLSIVRRQASTM